MKIKLNEIDVLELTETQKKVICHDIHEDIFEDECKRRLEWVLKHKYEQCFKRLKEEWEPKLKTSGISMIPTDEEAFAELVFSQSEYKNRKQREQDEA